MSARPKLLSGDWRIADYRVPKRGELYMSYDAARDRNAAITKAPNAALSQDGPLDGHPSAGAGKRFILELIEEPKMLAAPIADLSYVAEEKPKISAVFTIDRTLSDAEAERLRRVLHNLPKPPEPKKDTTPKVALQPITVNLGIERAKELEKALDDLAFAFNNHSNRAKALDCPVCGPRVKSALEIRANNNKKESK